MQRPPQNTTPPTVTNPDNNATELPESWQVYKPTDGLPVIEHLQLVLAPKLASGRASQAEINFYNANRPAHWASVAEWGNPPDDKPADPAKQQQQPAQQTPPAADLKQLAITADEHSERIAADINKLLADIDAHAASVFESERSRLREAGASDPDGNAKLLADQARDEKRRDVFKQHEQRLIAEIAKLQAHEKTAAERAQLADCLGERPSSLNLATLHALGSPERQMYAEQIRGMNAASLRAVAEQAKASGNRALAAAVKVANDALDKDARMFSSQQLCDALWGAEALQIWQSAVVTRTATQSALAMLRQLQTGHKDPVGMIRRGLAARSAGKTPPMPDSRDRLSDDHHISKIKRGLKAMAAADGSDGE